MRWCINMIRVSITPLRKSNHQKQTSFIGMKRCCSYLVSWIWNGTLVHTLRAGNAPMKWQFRFIRMKRRSVSYRGNALVCNHYFPYNLLLPQFMENPNPDLVSGAILKKPSAFRDSRVEVDKSVWVHASCAWELGGFHLFCNISKLLGFRLGVLGLLN